MKYLTNYQFFCLLLITSQVSNVSLTTTTLFFIIIIKHKTETSPTNVGKFKECGRLKSRKI